MISKVIILGLFVGLLFSGCYEKQPVVSINKEPIVQVKEVQKVKRVVTQVKKIKKKVEVIKQVLTKEQINVIEAQKKMELKNKLDEEALTNANKPLEADEVRDYTIDENTPLILKNKSEGKAYE